ncbi:MAG: class I SAM-dependent DNA methyltransferase [Acutalibacteraceae bacterium]|nr:class I SAM-dependent DNA methyltransferase [Acutalibacteraceae bacterium]
MINIRKLETELWEAADLLRADSKVTSQEYCMPVLGLIFLRYAYSRFKFVEADILKDRPKRNGRVLPVEVDDFKTKSAIFLPEEARYDYLINLPNDADVGMAINHAMELIEKQSEQLRGILPKNYTILKNDLLRELLRIFNNSAFNEIKDDVIGRIYEYFLNKFAPAVASDDGVFFTPKSLVRMIVNIIEPSHGTILDPACGSGGMFVSSADFIEQYGTNANTAMTFFGQEKVDYNAKLCIMNMAVHGLNAKIVSGDEANSFYHDAHNLEGCCDYVMANPPFNVDKVKSETAQNAGRLPFGLPGVNKNKEIGNANYLWISYFHAYLNETGRAGFVMASSATDSQGKDKIIREQLVNTGDVDVMLSVGNNFFYTKSLPCTLWFFDKNKREENKDKILFIDARNYYTVVDRTLNEWSHWQINNLNAIVWLYRGEVEKYKKLLEAYITEVISLKEEILVLFKDYKLYFPVEYKDFVNEFEEKFSKIKLEINEDTTENSLISLINYVNEFNIQLNKNSSHANGTADGFKAKEKKELLSKIGKKYSNWNQYKKDMERDLATIDQSIKSLATVITEFKWIYGKFGDGEYKDILGLCKCATKEEVSEKGYSLTPGAYVGVAPVEDDGVDFHERMTEIHKELLSLQAESNALMETISKNMKEMGL